MQVCNNAGYTAADGSEGRSLRIAANGPEGSEIRMMTPEERRRIYEEEKARIEAEEAQRGTRGRLGVFGEDWGATNTPKAIPSSSKSGGSFGSGFGAGFGAILGWTVGSMLIFVVAIWGFISCVGMWNSSWKEATHTATAPPSTATAPSHAKAATVAPAPAPTPETEMRNAASVQVIRKVYLPADGGSGGQFRPWPEVTFTVQITNTGHKDIRAVRGTITFATLFGDPIDKTRWTFDAGVKAGQHASEQVTMTLYYEGGDKLANPLSNLKVLWEPDGIIFSDGTTLGNVSQE